MSYSTDMVLDVDKGMNPPPPPAGSPYPQNVRHNLIKIIMITYWLYTFLFTYADKGVLRSNYQ